VALQIDVQSDVLSSFAHQTKCFLVQTIVHEPVLC